MSDSQNADNTDLDDLLAAYNIAVTDDNGDDVSGGGNKSSDNFLEPPAAKRSKRKNYVPHKPRHFLGEDGEGEEAEGGERKSISPSDRTTTPTPTSSRGSSRGPTPTPGGSGNSNGGSMSTNVETNSNDGTLPAASSTSVSLTPTSMNSSGGFNVSELRRHLQHQSRLQPSTISRPTIEPSEIYVAPNQPSPSNLRSMAPSAAAQLLNQQRKMAAAAKIAQQQQQQVQQQHQKKSAAPVGSTIISAYGKPPLGATLISNPVTPVGNQSLLQQQQQTTAVRSNPTSQGVRNLNAPRLSIVDNPSYVPPKKSLAASSISPNNVSVIPRSSAASTPRFGLVSGIPGGAAVLQTGVVGVSSSGMIGVVTPNGVATAIAVPASNIPQSVWSDKFIASPILKNQATLQKHSLQANTAVVKGIASSSASNADVSAALNAAPIVNLVSNTGAVIAVPSGGGIMTPLITTTTAAASSTAVSTSSSVLLQPKTQQSANATPTNASLTPPSQPVKTLPRDVVKSILTKKYVTPYKPREMPSSVVKDKMASGQLPGGAGPFSCTDCGDIFWMRTSYDNHRARRSMKLTLHCKWCEAHLTFYNKCVMLEHAREHSAKKQPLDLAKVVITPIPREFVSAGINTVQLEAEVAREAASVPSVNGDAASTIPTPIMTTSTASALSNNQGILACDAVSGTSTVLIPTSLLMNPQVALAPVIIGGGAGVVKKDGKPTASVVGSRNTLISVNSSTASFVPTLTTASLPPSQTPSETPTTTPNLVSLPSSVAAASLPKGGLLKCPECTVGAPSISALQSHFGECEQNINKSYQCYCGYFCPSPCALSAHKRIHTETRPFVCPECGALFNEKSTFAAHLQLMCLHYSRCPGYQCPKCGEAVVYSQLELVRSHVVTAHGETYYKCQGCPMAFKSMTSFDAHCSTHPEGASTGYKTIFKCPLCDTVFHQLGQQQQHMDTHMKDVAAKAKYAFKCSECKKFFDTKLLLTEHVKFAHFKDSPTKVCNMCFQAFTSDVDWQRHLGPDGKCRRWRMMAMTNGKGSRNGVAPNISPSKTGPKPEVEPVDVETEEEDDDIQEIQAINSGSAAETSTRNTASIISTLSSTFATTKVVPSLLSVSSDLPRDLEEDIPEGVVRVMPVPPRDDHHHHHHADNGSADSSNNKHPPSSSSSRTNFAEVSNWLFQENYRLMCKVCFEQYNSVTELTAHGRRHVQDGLNVCTHRYCQNLQFASRDALQAHVRSGHRTDLPEARPIIDIDHVPSKEGDRRGGNGVKDSNNSAEDDEERERTNGKKAKTDPGFSCAKCDFTSVDQATFMTHIVGHKTEKDSIQCADCGTCFAAEPSLRRHLIVAHKIRDFNSYLSRIAEVSRSLDRKSARNRAEEASRRSSPSSVASSDGGGPKECTVCYKPFESDAALKTHMRTHGMAFIRSKRFSIDN